MGANSSVSSVDHPLTRQNQPDIVSASESESVLVDEGPSQPQMILNPKPGINPGLRRLSLTKVRSRGGRKEKEREKEREREEKEEWSQEDNFVAYELG